jgi:flagellar biosynthesis chaperone FliJ
MSDLKYLSDGRKVSVIGKINQTEYIVQEIFITETGDEIPSGENFTAKSLHDAPVKSWKEKEVDKIEARHQKAQDEYKKLEAEIKLLKGKRQGYADILSQNEKFINLFNEADTTLLCDIVTGNIEYMVPISSYSSAFEVIHIEDGLFDFERSYYGETQNYKGLKMMQVLALKSSPYSSDRRCGLMVNQYIDGSGSNKEYKFFKTKLDVENYLIEKMNEYIAEDKLTIENIQAISKFLKVPEEVIKKVADKELERATIAKEISELNANKQYKKQVETLKANIDAINTP